MRLSTKTRMNRLFNGGACLDVAVDQHQRFMARALGHEHRLELLEMPGDVLPVLIDVFHSEADVAVRAILVRVAWERRDRSVLAFLSEALNDDHEEIWQQALDGLVARHEVLRVSFGPDGQTLCLAEQIPLDLSVVDASNDDEQLRQLRERERFRAWLVRMTWRLALDHRRGDFDRFSAHYFFLERRPAPAAPAWRPAQSRANW